MSAGNLNDGLSPSDIAPTNQTRCLPNELSPLVRTTSHPLGPSAVDRNDESANAAQSICLSGLAPSDSDAAITTTDAMKDFHASLRGSVGHSTEPLRQHDVSAQPDQSGTPAVDAPTPNDLAGAILFESSDADTPDPPNGAILVVDPSPDPSNVDPPDPAPRVLIAATIRHVVK